LVLIPCMGKIAEQDNSSMQSYKQSVSELNIY